MKAGILKKLGADNGGEVLVVCNMLCEYNECYGNISDRYCSYIGGSDFTDALECLYKGEIGNPLHILECGEIYDNEIIVAGFLADEIKNGGKDIACCDADDEGDEFRCFLSVNGADDNGKESDESADEANPALNSHNEAGSGGSVFECIAYRVAGK